MRGGIAASATGRRFSRSPPTERGQHRRVERRRRSLGLSPSSSRSHAIGGARRRRLLALGHRLAAPAAAERRRGPVWPFSSATRGMIATAPWPIANSPAFSSRSRCGVAEIVQPIDQLLLGQRLAAPQLERPREARAGARVDARRAAARRSAARSGRSSRRRRCSRRTAGTASDRGGDAHPALPPERDDPDADACACRAASWPA